MIINAHDASNPILSAAQKIIQNTLSMSNIQVTCYGKIDSHFTNGLIVISWTISELGQSVIKAALFRESMVPIGAEFSVNETKPVDNSEQDMAITSDDQWIVFTWTTSKDGLDYLSNE